MVGKIQFMDGWNWKLSYQTMVFSITYLHTSRASDIICEVLLKDSDYVCISVFFQNLGGIKGSLGASKCIGRLFSCLNLVETIEKGAILTCLTRGSRS